MKAVSSFVRFKSSETQTPSAQSICPLGCAVFSLCCCPSRPAMATLLAVCVCLGCIWTNWLIFVLVFSLPLLTQCVKTRPACRYDSDMTLAQIILLRLSSSNLNNGRAGQCAVWLFFYILLQKLPSWSLPPRVVVKLDISSAGRGTNECRGKQSARGVKIDLSIWWNMVH